MIGKFEVNCTPSELKKLLAVGCIIIWKFFEKLARKPSGPQIWVRLFYASLLKYITFVHLRGGA